VPLLYDHPDLILPVPLPAEDLTDIPSFYPFMDPASVQFWQQFLVQQIPTTMNVMPADYSDDFWLVSLPHFVAPDADLPVQVVPDRPMITLRSDQTPVDTFLIGSDILVDGDTEDNNKPVIWAARIFGILIEAKELEILWYDRENATSKEVYTLLERPNFVRLSMNTVLISHFAFTKKMDIPKAVLAKAIMLAKARVEDVLNGEDL